VANSNYQEGVAFDLGVGTEEVAPHAVTDGPDPAGAKLLEDRALRGADHDNQVEALNSRRVHSEAHQLSRRLMIGADPLGASRCPIAEPQAIVLVSVEDVEQ
jgi:hypothetical protein